MIRTRSALVGLMIWGLPALEVSGQVALRPPPVSIRIKAGNYDREQTPIRFELPEDRFGSGDREALDRGPVPFLLSGYPVVSRKGETYKVSPTNYTALAERMGAGTRVQVTFVLQGPVPKGVEVILKLHVGAYPTLSSPYFSLWSFDESVPGALTLKYHGGLASHGELKVFRYNAAPVSSTDYGPIQVRDAYIHPAYSPSGAVITGDFSSSHPHHRGFFLAYEKTRTGDLTPDFWNIHLGTGKIYADGLDKPVVSPVTARFSARHRWVAKDKATGKETVVLRERWDVEAYPIIGAPYFLFDITSTQQAVDRPLELLPYRYGGMAYRGPEPFVKGTLDVLTSEGKHRKDGDQKPARWVDLTGPIADGSDKYAGAMIADHPSNPNYPNIARIHPTTLPFFCYVPAHDKPLTIAVETPTVFRYRVLIHDGHPDAQLDERVARDFVEPPIVIVE